MEFRISYGRLTIYGQLILKIKLSFGNFVGKTTQSK